MKSLNHRENMLRAYRRDNPEFVPFEFSLSPYMMRVFKEKAGSEDPIEEYFRFSSRWIGPKRIKPKPDFNKYFLDLDLPENVEMDDWGTAIITKPDTEDAIRIAPLRDAKSLREVEDFPFPQPEDYDFEEYTKRVRNVKEKGFCVHGGGGGSLFETCWGLRGFENFLIDMMTNKELAHTICDIVTEISVKFAIKYTKSGVDVLTMGCDVAAQEGLLMSINAWREFVKPMIKSIITVAKKVNPEILIFYHSDGKIEELIPELIEVGVDILNPIQPECNDIFSIKKRWGDNLSLFGGIGVQSTLPFSTPDEVKEVVKRIIGIMGNGGGYVLSPAHLIRQEVPWRNVLAFVEAAKEHGRYNEKGKGGYGTDDIS